MGLFNNVGRYSDIHEYIKNFKEQTQSGLKLDVNNNYDIEGKRLANVGQGVDADDAVVMHQMESFDTDLETKLTQLKADSLQVDGSSHMTGDLDLRGQKLINPGEIEMNRKLITNLDTDEENDLSAVNMITLKKFHPDAPEPTHEVTKNIDLKELFNVVKSKQRNLNELKTHYDSLVSFEEVKENFLSRQEEFPMETQLNMNHNSITNLKDPQFGGEAATKTYVDSSISSVVSSTAGSIATRLPLSGGTMTGPLDMGTKSISNLPTPKTPSEATSKQYVDRQLNLKVGNVVADMIETEVRLKKYVDDSHNTTGLPKDSFRYLMEEVDESSSESGITETAIVDFPNSPHLYNKKAYAFKVAKDDTNLFAGRLGLNMFKLPEGEFTLCIEFFPAKMTGVSVNVVSASLNVGKQTTKKLANYSRSIVHLHKWRISPPEYIFLDLKWQGTAQDLSKKGAKLIVYGIAGSHDDVPSDVFGAPFAFEGGAMVMQTDLDLNGHKIDNSNLKNNFMLIGRFRSSESGTNILFDNYFNDIVIPIRCKLIKVYSQILSKTSPFPQLTLFLAEKASQSGTNASENNRIQTFHFQMLFIMKESYFQQQYMLNQVIAGLAKSHFFLKLSNKMRKRRKQSIFDFNHIDPHIQEEELEEIKNLFRFYHKRFWCLKRAHGRFKKMNLLINLTSSGLVAIGTIAGGVTMNPIVLGVISGLGLVVKTASEMKNLKSKIEMSKFAFTTYEKTLSDLRFALRGGNFDQN